jgi:hypothetical protein
VAELFELTELASLLQSDLDTATATLCRKMATGAIKAHTGQTFALVADDAVDLYGGGDRLTLPQRPVTAVGAVSEPAWAGVAATSLVSGTDYDRLGAVLYRTGRLWAPLVRVVYSHGYATTADVDDEVRDVALRVAAQLYGNPEQLQRESTEGHDVSYARQLLTDDDKRQLDRLFGRSRLRSVLLT